MQPVFSDGVDADVDYGQAMAVLIPADVAAVMFLSLLVMFPFVFVSASLVP